MNINWFNKLIGLLKVQSNSENEKLMMLYLDKELRKLKLPYTIDAAGNILVTKGKSKLYPCVVSHLDTVHDFVDNLKIYTDTDDNDVLFAMNGKQRIGVGGDDKCGILACLYMLEVLPTIKVVFFSGEESGCRGSGKINHRFFADCMYLIQLDRRGKRDFIQTYWGNKTISHEFSSEIGLIKKKYKYKNAIGTITDVMKLWYNKVGISCINLSCGYYKPHTDYEYISVNDLWRSIKFTEEIINTLQPKRYTSLPPKPVVVKTWVNTSGSNINNSLYRPCSVCYKYKKVSLMCEVKGSPDKKICWRCRSKQIDAIGASETKQDDKLTRATIFACNECGVKALEMKAGDSLKYINGVLYCNGCGSLVGAKESPLTKCESCQEEIPKGHSCMIQGILVCEECAGILEEYAGKDPNKKCWTCDRVIPKDHKVIERFGVRICEDCALPSDIEVNNGTKAC